MSGELGGGLDVSSARRRFELTTSQRNADLRSVRDLREKRHLITGQIARIARRWAGSTILTDGPCRCERPDKFLPAENGTFFCLTCRRPG